MSFDDDVLVAMDATLFDAFGVDGTVQRGLAVPAPVRIVVDRGVQRLGDYGQSVGLVSECSFMRSQWTPIQGDVVRWTDRYGDNIATLETTVEDDGFVAKHVMAIGVVL